ncbi:MAG: glycosyltransferase family 10 [Gemmiger sp.]|nr:glycosyltransferase family 10 [Gemmiger sp.]
MPSLPARRVRLAFCDLAGDWNAEDNYFTRALRRGGYQIDACHSPAEQPDFVICGTFGHDFLQYSCCRIQFSGEDNWPDLNLFDYAMGFPLLNYGGRYLRLPLYALRDSWPLALQKHTLPAADFAARKKFCNFVVSNDFSAVRNEFFAALSAHRQVDSGGQYANNLGGPVADKLAFQRQYKFSIAYENSRDPGYCTEKIVDAFAAGTVPIYWGDPEIKGEFNPAAFICADDYPDTPALLAALDALDADDAAFLAICQAPILLPESRAARYQTDEAAFRFLDGIFQQGPHLCRNQSCWGSIYENDLRYYHRLAETAKQPLLQRLFGRKA